MTYLSVGRPIALLSSSASVFLVSPLWQLVKRVKYHAADSITESCHISVDIWPVHQAASAVPRVRKSIRIRILVGSHLQVI